MDADDESAAHAVARLREMKTRVLQQHGFDTRPNLAPTVARHPPVDPELLFERPLLIGVHRRGAYTLGDETLALCCTRAGAVQLDRCAAAAVPRGGRRNGGGGESCVL